jgi:hypothetical protein
MLNLDEIIATCMHHAHDHFKLYSRLKKYAQSYCINNHELLKTCIYFFEVF